MEISSSRYTEIGIFSFFTFIEVQGASHGELNQPSPQFQADRPQSVKVYGHIEGHSNLQLFKKREGVLKCVDCQGRHDAPGTSWFRGHTLRGVRTY
jgi:hypothetical protein